MDHRSILSRACTLIALVALSGCLAAGHTSSPWEWGGGVRIAPGLWNVSPDGVTVHPTVGYTYLSFEGGNDQLFELGGQIRFPLGTSDRQLWVGGEATFSRLRTSVDVPGGGSLTGSTNGYALTGLVGLPVGSSRWGPNIFAGAGISDYGSQGWNIRLGVDLQPTFLWER